MMPESAPETISPRSRIAELNDALLSAQSATLVLEDWCERYLGIPCPARVTARLMHRAEITAPPDLRSLLRLDAGQKLRHRLLQLCCGAHILSDAENWYVPARLTPDMNRALDETDISFGHIVRPLNFKRKTLASHILWIEEPGVAAASQLTAMPLHLLEHRACLSTEDGTPFSLVVEKYRRDILWPEYFAGKNQPARLAGGLI